MIFAGRLEIFAMPMQPKNSSSTSSVLLVLLLLITFPFWIGIIAAVGGILAGVFGAIFGIAGGLLGAFFGVIGGLLSVIAEIISWPFKMLFGWHELDWWPHVHCNGFLVAALVILALVVSKRKAK
jgi:hypothetical protein